MRKKERKKEWNDDDHDDGDKRANKLSSSVIGQLSESYDCQLAVDAIKSKGIETKIR